MSSEKLGSAKELLKGNLGGSWDLLEGCEGNYTELGIARNFGGASAAYSLRDVGAMNGRVVRVRRMPHDPGDADGDGGNADTSPNDETDFSANQVQSGSVEDWVNGKLESTLPVDLDPTNVAAAYSLRKVKASYTGNAVRIRRSSDEIEVNVAFDSNDKVSSSSAITNLSEEGGESGQTTATTLGEFINHSGDFGDFRVDNEWSDNLLSFSSVGKTSFSVEAKSLGSFNSSDTVRVSAPITKVIAEPQASITKFKTTFTIDSISGEGNGNATDGALYVKGANSPNGNGSWNLHNLPDGAGGDETFKFTSAGTYTVEGYGEDATDAFNLAFRTFSFIIYSGTKVSVSNVSMEVLNDCSVHTWYDQAGSKDATKITAINQPKIAENGALLTGGIKFNGSTTSLSTGSQVLTANETGSQSLYTVCNVTDGSSGYIAGSATDDDNGVKIGQSIYYYTTTDVFALSNGNTATNTTIDRINAIRGKDVLVSFNYNNNTANTLNQNANQNGYSDGSSAYDFEANDNFIIGARGGTVQAGRALSGFIQEVIAYNSDQADNHYKIESNINNYYNLYNDANDIFQSAWQNEGSETSFTSTSVDGFTYSNSSQASFTGVTLSNSLALNDSIYVSFNATNVTYPGSNSQSPQLRLRDGLGSGSSASSDTNHVVNGFNAFKLTYDTGGNGNHIVFSEGDTGGGSVTISDFKVSRFARDGFVETWYDQSGNGRDMVQDTAGYQPRIVRNGGQVKDPSGHKPSINFGLKGTGQGALHLKVPSNVPQASSNTLTALFVASLDTDTVTAPRLAAASIDFNLSSSEVLQSRFGNNRTSTPNLTLSTFDNSFLGFTFNSSSVPKYYLGNSAASTASAHSGTATPTVFQILGENAIGGDTLDRYHWSGTISEAILYLTDLDSDIEDFKNNINNYYKVF